MSLLSPVNATQVSRSGWLFVVWIFMPLTIHLIIWWHFYFTFKVGAAACIPAVLLGSLLSWWLYRRTVRLSGLGLHSTLASGEFPLKIFLWKIAVVMAVSWAWTLLAISFYFIFSTPAETRLLTVSAVRECSGKCNGCTVRVIFSDWQGAQDARFCADGLRNLPTVGEKLALRGKFGNQIQYVNEVYKPLR